MLFRRAGVINHFTIPCKLAVGLRKCKVCFVEVEHYEETCSFGVFINFGNLRFAVAQFLNKSAEACVFTLTGRP